jgi:hypothetical protein
MPIIGSTAGQSGKIPEAPTITGTTSGSGQVTIAFTEPAYKGKGNVTYTATSSPGGLTGTSSTSPTTVSGLSNGTPYTFTITVTTADGVSTSSSASSSVTLVIPQGAYFAGGEGPVNQPGGRNPTANIDKLSFDTDSVSTISATISSLNSNLFGAGFANSGTAGYYAGGYNNAGLSKIDKLTFSSESRSTISATFSAGRSYTAACANSGTAGYMGGGQDDATAGSNRYGSSDIQKLTFSNDSRSTIGATLSTNISNHAAMANSGTAGYWGSGNYYDYSQIYYSKINKLTFSNETRSILTAQLTNGNVSHYTPVANSGTAGYWMGGNELGTQIARIDKMSFSNDTISSISGLARVAMYGAGAAKSGTAGYMGGGYTDSGYSTSYIVKITFSTDTRTEVSNRLSTNKQSAGAFANSGAL